MRWSWNVGTFRGIRVRVHWTLLLLLALVGVSEWGADGSFAAAIAGVALLAALFCCVLLHEFGHALAAKRYGIGTRSITLLPFGGIAALERLPSTPRHELVVALAGPAVNVVLAALFGALLPIVPAASEAFVWTLFVVNVSLALFNLLPAFPMDGGRVLRALLATRIGLLRATRIAAGAGKVLAAGFVVLGIFIGNPILLLIAMVVWVQGSGELRHVEQRSRSRAAVLSSHDPLAKPLAIFARTGQTEFPVFEQKDLVGVLRREQLSLAFARFGPEMTVGGVMERIRPMRPQPTATGS
jgi:Zn-dependent protease